MNDTFEQVRHLMAKEFQLDPTAIRRDSPLADLGVDSLAALEFAFELESAFGITLDQSTDLRGATVADVVAVVDAARAGTRAGASADPPAAVGTRAAALRSAAD